VQAQQDTFAAVLVELRAGRKRWQRMWMVFASPESPVSN
jgi:uncharacterized protein (DUF1810 family)